MNRIARTLGRRVGLSITAAFQHVLPPNLSSWKLALYVVVFLIPGGSVVVLGLVWLDNQRARKAKESARRDPPLLPRTKHCDA
jgi:hypothetical protein